MWTRCLSSPEEGGRAPGAGGPDDCEQSDMGAGTRLGSSGRTASNLNC